MLTACNDKSGDQNAEGSTAEADAPRHAISVTVKGEKGEALVLLSVPDGWSDAKVAKSLTAPLHAVQKSCGAGERPDYALDVAKGKVEGVTTQVDENADDCVVKALSGVVIDDATGAPTGKVYVRWPAATPKASST